MRIELDPGKSEVNRIKHGVALIAAEALEWDTTIRWPDTRKDYGEDRMCGMGYIGLTLHFGVFVGRGRSRCIICLPKANRNGVKRYAETESQDCHPHCRQRQGYHRCGAP